MNDRPLELLTVRSKVSSARAAGNADRANTPADAGSDDEEECRAFGYLRGIRDRALSIEFRFADGNSLAFPYTWLGPMQYNRSAGILLTFSGDQITLVLLEGSNLNALVNGSVSLYDRGIQRHRVTWVREMPKQEAAAVRQLGARAREAAHEVNALFREVLPEARARKASHKQAKRAAG